jgi:hypothetical protein
MMALTNFNKETVLIDTTTLPGEIQSRNGEVL